jgi:hypothetical protein
MAVAIKECCKMRAGTELGRCKQCGSPYCTVCVVTGPTGRFCSQECKQKHEAFAQKAQQMQTKARGSTWIKVRQSIAYLIAMAAIIAAAIFGLTLFEVPVLSDIAWTVRNLLGV